jgi:hypothetical protein
MLLSDSKRHRPSFPSPTFLNPLPSHPSISLSISLFSLCLRAKHIYTRSIQPFLCPSPPNTHTPNNECHRSNIWSTLLDQRTCSKSNVVVQPLSIGRKGFVCPFQSQFPLCYSKVEKEIEPTTIGCQSHLFAYLFMQQRRLQQSIFPSQQSMPLSRYNG